MSDPASPQLVPFDRRYLLVSNIPHYVDAGGAVYLDRSWRIDLAGHVAYLPQLRVASPRHPLPTQHGLLERFECDRDMFIALPQQQSLIGAVWSLPRTSVALARAVGWSEVVHTGIAGWPYPVGWLATLFAKMRGRARVVMVESAPWRPQGNAADSVLARRMRAPIYEALARWSCAKADLALFTQATYRESLLKDTTGPNFVTPATWIDADSILDAAIARRLWADKRTQPARFAFVGRLNIDKGVMELLEALRLLDARGVCVAVDFVGSGDCKPAIEQGITKFKHVRVRLLNSVPYGDSLFALLDTYHALIVPSLGDEQPRIVFDAFARAIPLLAFATDGIMAHVQDGVTGKLVPKNDVRTLSDTIATAIDSVLKLEAMGLAALETVRTQTHFEMHRRRSQLLAAHLQSSRLTA